ncbi:hypothetical protein [Paenibacillus sp. Y412MC10]|uniref:hypothetical protein n=1 Tax=Geobacillus sp. (strain Y412MC10) TaxID=481743 RepID=UPI0011A68682|nr:hypothetical protein [Paenibacillus sp. Y412MC10]
MRVELQFLDQSGDRLNELDMEYEGFVPIPNVGDAVVMEGRHYRVTSRNYMYFSSEAMRDDVRVLLYVEE